MPQEICDSIRHRPRHRAGFENARGFLIEFQSIRGILAA
jgi:hypothetical protein